VIKECIVRLSLALLPTHSWRISKGKQTEKEGAIPEAEFLNEIQTKASRVFLLVIHSHLYSFAGDFLFFKLTQPLTVSVKEKGGIPDRKPYPLSYGLRNPYRNLKTENSQDYAQKPLRGCTFMNSASGRLSLSFS
jgi:hypothetical protein